MSASATHGDSAWGRVDAICDQYESDRRRGSAKPLREYVVGDLQPAERELLLRELLSLEFEIVTGTDGTVALDRYLTELPDDERIVRTAYERFQSRRQGRSESAASDESARLAPGREIGAYTIVEAIGAGGMGHVYKARHATMDRDVALKVLLPQLVSSPDAVSRFRREIKAAARLEHPNIVTAFDAGEQDGLHYLVMQYVDGRDLGSYVKAKGALPVKQAVKCVIQAARGLEYAHQQGIVHRDIKPHNLLVDRSGTVKLLDMGLARFEIESGENAMTDLTASGMFMGTVDYMAPEQSADTRTADARSDIYSLGCTLHFLLTGQPVYRAETLVKRILAHRDGEIPSLSDRNPQVPEQLDLVFQRMVAKAPDERYQTMGEVVESLQSCLVTEKVPAAAAVAAPASKGSGSGSDAAVGLGDSNDNTPALAQTDSFGGFETFVATPSPVIGRHLKRKRAASRSGGLVGRQRWLWLAGAGGVAALLFGVIITITGKDGQKTTVHVPDGSQVNVNNDGTVDVTLPEKRSTPFKEERPVQEYLPKLGDSDTAYAADRKVAESVLSVGGSVTVQLDNNQSLVIETVGDLPQDRFKLISVSLYGLKEVRDEFFKDLPGLPFLKYAGLQGTGAGEHAIQWLGRCPQLNRLHAGTTPFVHLPTSRFAQLKRLRGLNNLQMDSNQIDDHWAFLRELPSVKSVVAWRAEPPPLPEHPDRFESLYSIWLPQVEELPAKYLEALRANPHLRILLGRSMTVAGADPLLADARSLLEAGVVLSGTDTSGEPWSSESTAITDVKTPLVDRATLPVGMTMTDDLLAPLSRISPHLWELAGQDVVGADRLIEELTNSDVGVERLNLRGSDLTSAGLKCLHQRTDLIGLNVLGTSITAEDLDEFREQVPGCWVISSFGSYEAQHRLPPGWGDDAAEHKPTPNDDVRLSGTDDPYAVDRDVAEWVLSVGGSVEVSRISEFRLEILSEPGSLPAAPFDLLRVSLPDSSAWQNPDLERLTQLPQLRRVYLPDSAQLDLQGLDFLSDCPSLEILIINRMTFGSRELTRLQSCLALWQLGVQSDFIDDGWEFLNSLPALIQLSVYGPNVPDIAALAGFPQLRTIRFPHLDKLDAGLVTQLQSANSKLRLIVNRDGRLEVIGNDPEHVAARQLANHGWEVSGKLLNGGDWNSSDNDAWNGNDALRVTRFQIPAERELSAEDCELLDVFSEMHMFNGTGLRGSPQLIACLTKRPKIGSLHLDNSDLTDSELADIERIFGLGYLSVPGTQVTEAGIARLRRALPQCRVLSDFGMFEPENRYRPEGTLSDLSNPYAIDREVAEWVLSVGGSVGGFQVGDGRAKEYSALEELPTEPFVLDIMWLKGSPNWTNTDLKRLCQLPRLRRLFFGPPAQVNSDGLEFLIECRNLRSLGLNGATIHSAELAGLKACAGLNQLQVHADFVDDRWEFLGALPALTQLHVFGRNVPAIDELGKFPQLRSIKFLDLADLDAALVTQLQTANPNLRLIVKRGDRAVVVGRDPELEAARQLVNAGWELGGEYLNGGEWNSRSPDPWNGADAIVVSDYQMLTTRTVSADDCDALQRCSECFGMNAAGLRESRRLVACLADRPFTARLVLNNADLTDDELLILERVVGLQSLNVLGTDVTEAGVARFRQALPHCRVISNFGTFEPEHRFPTETEENDPAVADPPVE